MAIAAYKLRLTAVLSECFHDLFVVQFIMMLFDFVLGCI